MSLGGFCLHLGSVGPRILTLRCVASRGRFRPFLDPRPFEDLAAEPALDRVVSGSSARKFTGSLEEGADLSGVAATVTTRQQVKTHQAAAPDACFVQLVGGNGADDLESP